MDKRVFVIIPAYNESEVIAATAQPLLQLGYEVVIVNDGSTTDIRGFLKKLRVHYLQHEINLGQGAALQTGMDYAAKFSPDYVVHFDADGQHSTRDIERFIQLLEERKVDIVLGSRFLEAATQLAVPFRRRLLLKTARFVNWLFTGVMLTDAHNGFRVFRGSIMPKLRMTENRMAHATEILRLIKKGKIAYTESASNIQYTDYSMQKGQKAPASFHILIDLIFHRFIKL